MTDPLRKDPLSDFDPSKAEGAADGPSPLRRILPGFAWVSCLAILVFIVPRFERLFADFGVELPRVTIVLIGISHAIDRYAPAVVVLAAAVWVVAGAFPRRVHECSSKAGFATKFVIPMVFLALEILALMMPLMNLLDKLSG